MEIINTIEVNDNLIEVTELASGKFEVSLNGEPSGIYTNEKDALKFANELERALK